MAADVATLLRCAEPATVAGKRFGLNFRRTSSQVPQRLARSARSSASTWTFKVRMRPTRSSATPGQAGEMSLLPQRFHLWRAPIPCSSAPCEGHDRQTAEYHRHAHRVIATAQPIFGLGRREEP